MLSIGASGYHLTKNTLNDAQAVAAARAAAKFRSRLGQQPAADGALRKQISLPKDTIVVDSLGAHTQHTATPLAAGVYRWAHCCSLSAWHACCRSNHSLSLSNRRFHFKSDRSAAELLRFVAQHPRHFAQHCYADRNRHDQGHHTCVQPYSNTVLNAQDSQRLASEAAAAARHGSRQRRLAAVGVAPERPRQRVTPPGGRAAFSRRGFAAAGFSSQRVSRARYRGGTVPGRQRCRGSGPKAAARQYRAAPALSTCRQVGAQGEAIRRQRHRIGHPQGTAFPASATYACSAWILITYKAALLWLFNALMVAPSVAHSVCEPLHVTPGRRHRRREGASVEGGSAAAAADQEPLHHRAHYPQRAAHDRRPGAGHCAAVQAGADCSIQSCSCSPLLHSGLTLAP